MKLSNIFDFILERLKWPIAVWMLISLPALVDSLDFFRLANYAFFALGAGFVMFFVTRTMTDASIKTNMQIAAHELTHSFFAFITFHKIRHIRIDPEGSGGEMGFIGKGNWLITIAPYFFPLFAVCYMIFMSFMPQNLIFNGILGYFLGYHMDTIASQIHEKQADLPKVGYGFCLMFLPGANLWIIGSVMAFNTRGWSGIKVYFDLINQLNIENIKYVLQLAF